MAALYNCLYCDCDFNCDLNISGDGTGDGGASTPDSDTEPEITCSCTGGAAKVRVTVRAADVIDPNPQYCFIRLTGASNWTSPPQAFGPGETVLEFTGLPEITGAVEVLSCFTTNYNDAVAGNVDAAPIIAKSYLSSYPENEKRSPEIEYDCMVGKDIRGTLNGACSELGTHLENVYKKVNTCPMLVADETAIAVAVIPDEEGFRTFVNAHFWTEFSQNIANQSLSYDVDACVFAISSISFPINGETGVMSFSRNYPSERLGKRGAVTVILVDRVMTALGQPHQQNGYNWLVAHELGHALGNLRDYTSDQSAHSSSGCLMNEMPVSGSTFHTDKNKAFCDKCKGNFAANNWEWEK